VLFRFLLMIASSDESTIASYRSPDGMKSDLLLMVGRSSHNRNPKDFRPRTNGRTVNLEFWNVSARRPEPVGRELHRRTVVSVPRLVNAVAFVDSLLCWAAGNSFTPPTTIQDNSFGTIC